MMVVVNEELEIFVNPSHDGYEFQIGGVSGELTNLKFTTRYEIEGDLSLRAVFGRIYWGRVNLHSSSKRAEIAHNYTKRGGAKEYPFALALEILFQWVASHHAIQCEVWDYRYGEAFPIEYLCPPILPKDSVTVLAGDGGIGKGYMALAIALSVAANANIIPATVQGAVLYVDYESNRADYAIRLDKLIRGHEIELLEMYPLRYLRMDTPYLLARKEIERQVFDLQAKLVIIDSLAPACMGGMEDSESAIALMRALRSLDCTVLAIAHLSKSERDSDSPSPYGSVFVRNLARNVWVQKRVSSTSGRLTVQLIHQKSNLDTLHKTRYYDLVFTPESVSVSFISDLSRSDIQSQLPMTERVLSVMTHAMTAQEIAQALGEQPVRIHQTLQRLIAQQRVRIHDGRGTRNQPYRYILLEQGQAQVSPQSTIDNTAQGAALSPFE